jgi:hypothetical protein
MATAAAARPRPTQHQRPLVETKMTLARPTQTRQIAAFVLSVGRRQLGNGREPADEHRAGRQGHDQAERLRQSP